MSPVEAVWLFLLFSALPPFLRHKVVAYRRVPVRTTERELRRRLP